MRDLNINPEVKTTNITVETFERKFLNAVLNLRKKVKNVIQSF